MERNDDTAKKPRIVLIVDDEAILRLVATDFLEDAGISTLDAASADEALVRLEQHGDINFVFSDIQMPGSMDGVGLAIIIRERWPHIRVILTSGRVRPTAHALPDGVILMPKPYEISALVPMIRAA